MDDRRRHARQELETGLVGTTRDGSRITLIELSAEGCRVHAQRVVRPGTNEVLRFRVMGEAGIVSVPAVAVHATPVPWVFTPSELVGYRLDPDDAGQLARALGRVGIRSDH